MRDPTEHFRALDLMEAPDLWPDIAARDPRPRGASSARRRLVAALLALVAAAAATTLAVRAFTPSDTRLGLEPPPAGRVVNGEIWFVRGGGDGPSHILSIEPDGSGERLLFSDGRDPTVVEEFVRPEAVGMEYDWAPDGSAVVFAHHTEVDPEHKGSRYELFTMSPEDGELSRVTTDNALASFPSWSSDGRSIAYSSSRTGQFVAGCWGTALCPSDIFVIGADGSGHRQLTDHPADDSQPDWSPDGSRIVFVSGRDDRRADLYVMGADGGNVVRLGVGLEFVARPAWSPDGSVIAFIEGSGGRGGIHLVRPDGGELTEVWRCECESVYDLTWSPDGTLLAFTASVDGTAPQLHVMESDGSGDRTIALDAAHVAWRPLPAPPSSPAPSESPAAPPPGVLPATPSADFVGDIAFRVSDGRSTRIAVMRPDGSGRQVLRSEPARPGRRTDPGSPFVRTPATGERTSSS